MGIPVFQETFFKLSKFEIESGLLSIIFIRSLCFLLFACDLTVLIPIFDISNVFGQILHEANLMLHHF